MINNNTLRPVNSGLNISIAIEQEKHLRLVVDEILNPLNNHIVFEINTEKKTIEIAPITIVYTDKQNTIHWNDAINPNFGKEKQIIKKLNCVYFSCLNYTNLLRHQKKLGINLSDYEYIKEKHNAGSNISVEVKEYKKG